MSTQDTPTKNIETLERETGIEPVSLAWKAKVLPLNYSRTLLGILLTCSSDHHSMPACVQASIASKKFALVEEAGFEPA